MTPSWLSREGWLDLRRLRRKGEYDQNTWHGIFKQGKKWSQGDENNLVMAQKQARRPKEKDKRPRNKLTAMAT